MFIQVQETPNPMTLKFLPGRRILVESGRTYEFTDTRQAKNSQLAGLLMRIDGVKSVFFGEDFLTVTKTSEDEEWSLIKPHVFATVMDYLQSGKPVISEETGSDHPTDTTILPEDDEVVATIKELLETRIKPMVQEDGGDVIFVGFENGVVRLRLQGSCTGCPSSAVTLKQGIKNMMQFYVPEVKDIVEESDEQNLVDEKFEELEKSIRTKPAQQARQDD